MQESSCKKKENRMTVQTLVRRGIVLRSFMPYKHKVSLFEFSLGRIEGMLQNQHLLSKAMHGALVQFRVEEVQSFYRFHDFELIALPHPWVMEDIYFLHHLLELTDYFVPFGEFSESLGLVFMYLFQECPCIDRELFKKIIVAHFFVVLGVYPENVEFFPTSFFRLISGSVDSMLEATWDVQQVHMLTHWLESCIKVHPYAHQFKTVLFYEKMDIK